MVSHRAIGCTGCTIWILMACSAGGNNPTPAERSVGPTDLGNAAGSPSSSTGNGSGVTGSGASGEGGPMPMYDGPASSNVPCDVAAIVAEHCTTCHAETPKFNAPMSLVKAEDFNRPAPISGTQPVRAVASRRINAEGAARMPPPGTVEALDAAEIATLTAWLDGGATPATDGCAIGADAVAAIPELLPRPTKTGTVLGPYEGWDEDGVECYPFLTYAAGGANKDAPYVVGTAVDRYMGFGFTPPWEGTRYVRAFKSVIDNAQALHHWILFEEPSVADGSVTEIIGAHPGGAMLHGWAPGGSDLFFSPDVGIRMEGSSAYLLEVHYNSSDAGAVDASGLEICVTETPPENEAIISWLGTDFINGTSATGTCRPRATEPIHIIAGTPHMHLKGTAMKVTIDRAAGGTEVVHDEAFAFQNQRGYAEDIIINSGDAITTTCTYNAPSTFGQGTNDEMCYWFALAYPAGALSDGGLIGTFVHGGNACLGL